MHSILSEEPNPTWKATSSSHHPATCRDVVFCFCGYGLQDLAERVGGEKGEGNVVNPEPDTQATT